MPKYNMQDAVGDLVAGITVSRVSLTVLLQALAYTGIACVIILGKCKEIPKFNNKN